MMSLSASAGITVPPVRLVHRDELDGLPPNVWPGREEWAFAVRRFDRTDAREPVHIEDLAQVRNVYPDNKYQGNYETVAALVYRGRDISGLREFARRLAFTVLISNGDAHLKNWSLIYPRRPDSPARTGLRSRIHRFLPRQRRAAGSEVRRYPTARPDQCHHLRAAGATPRCAHSRAVRVCRRARGEDQRTLARAPREARSQPRAGHQHRRQHRGPQPIIAPAGDGAVASTFAHDRE